MNSYVVWISPSTNILIVFWKLNWLIFLLHFLMREFIKDNISQQVYSSPWGKAVKETGFWGGKHVWWYGNCICLMNFLLAYVLPLGVPELTSVFCSLLNHCFSEMGCALQAVTLCLKAWTYCRKVMKGQRDRVGFCLYYLLANKENLRTPALTRTICITELAGFVVHCL